MATQPKRVLVLDDERVIADVLSIVLSQSGYDARPAYNHSTAVAIAREFRPHLLITGFNNACEKNGCETAIEVLGLLPDCNVLISSGQAATAIALEDYRRRGYDFDVLAKPVHPDDLLEKVRKVFRTSD
jgi:DNA-binding NtrC family response regulator